MYVLLCGEIISWFNRAFSHVDFYVHRTSSKIWPASIPASSLEVISDVRCPLFFTDNRHRKLKDGHIACPNVKRH